MITSEALQSAFAYLFPAELAALKDLARSLPPNPVVVNIGAGSGTSGLAFMESREDLFLITFDIQRDNSPLGCLYAEEMVLKQAGFFGRNRQICLDSAQGGKEWQKYKGNHIFATPPPDHRALADLVFVDGDHTYNGCKDDILAWLPNIKPGGIMAVHDYDKKNVYKRTDLPARIPHPHPWPGVDRAVKKFLCPFFETILHIDTLIVFRFDERNYSKLLESLRHNLASPSVK